DSPNVRTIHNLQTLSLHDALPLFRTSAKASDPAPVLSRVTVIADTASTTGGVVSSTVTEMVSTVSLSLASVTVRVILKVPTSEHPKLVRLNTSLAIPQASALSLFRTSARESDPAPVLSRVTV